MRAPLLAALALALAGCGSATQAIADAANEVRVDASAVRESHTAIRADLVTVRSAVAGADVKWPDNGKTFADALKDAEDRLGAGDAALRRIEDHASKINSEVTQTHDNESQWLRLVKYAAWIAAPALILALLWWSGVLGFVRGWLGLVTPATRLQAKLDAEKVVAGPLTPDAHAEITARRLNPAFNVTFQRARAKVLPATPPDAPPAPTGPPA